MRFYAPYCDDFQRGCNQQTSHAPEFLHCERQQSLNYRHVYHAGNFADVLKHIVLLLCLDYLQKKEGALCIVDAHGGAGLYDLASEEATKTREWERGIGCLQGGTGAPSDLQLYLDAVQGDLKERRYPGSPLLTARGLRPQDSLIANELHEPAFEALRHSLAPFKNARATRMDAYECIRAHIPPKERRGLVLIDPPFEEKDEFETLARQMRQWKKLGDRRVYALVSDQGALAGGGAEGCGPESRGPADMGGGSAHPAARPARNPEWLRRYRLQCALYRARAGGGAFAGPEGCHEPLRHRMRLGSPRLMT